MEPSPFESVHLGLNKQNNQPCPSRAALGRFEAQISGAAQGLAPGEHKFIPSNV